MQSPITVHREDPSRDMLRLLRDKGLKVFKIFGLLFVYVPRGHDLRYS